MHPKLKKFLIISAKNAVNAILTNTVLMTMLGNWTSLTTLHGWILVGKIALSCVIARETMIWLPKLLAWSQSETVVENEAQVDVASSSKVVVSSAQNPATPLSSPTPLAPANTEANTQAKSQATGAP